MKWMLSTGETTTLADKLHLAPNATISKSQGTLKKIVGKRMVNPMVTKAFQINSSDSKTMQIQRNVHIAGIVEHPENTYLNLPSTIKCPG